MIAQRTFKQLFQKVVGNTLYIRWGEEGFSPVFKGPLHEHVLTQKQAEDWAILNGLDVNGALASSNWISA